ncbi:MAG: BsuPI-related putative proteinase inhibitor [Gemmatimonadota bacterium]
MLLLLACSTAPQGDETQANMAPNQLVTSLEVEVARDSVRFILHLTNSGTQPEVLGFRSGQRYDFEVRTAAGEKIWRWSDDRAFTMAMGSETLAPGESRQYSESWTPGNRSGAFIAVGRVVAMGREIEQQARFEISKS